MEKPAAKRVRLSTEDVLLELGNEDEPMTAGSDDEFDDITCEEKEREEWGESDSASNTNAQCDPGLPASPSHSVSVSPPHSMSVSPSHSLLDTQLSYPSHAPPAISLASFSGAGPSQTLPTSVSHLSSGAWPSHTLTVSSLPSSSDRPVSPTLSLSGRESVSPLQTSPSQSSGPSASHTRSSTSSQDPLTLPLSAYLSLPLSSLVQALNQAMSPQPLSTAVPPLTSTSGTSNLAVYSGPSGTSAPRRPARHPQSQSSHQDSRSQHPRSGSTASSGSWSRNLEPIDVAPFVEEVGPTVQIPGVPVDVFRLLFTDELCRHITQHTNLYAEQVMGTRFTTWDKVSEEEVRAYFSFQIFMGIVTEPATEDYWRRDELHFGPIADRISRKRFRDIHCFLHFVDNTTLAPRGHPQYDRLGKVRPVMNMVQKKVKEVYKPHCENAMDEAMIPFDGGSGLKQYMPAKPVKRGIKVWCRADSHNGYMCDFQVYTGRREGAEGGLGKRVVLDLSQSLEGKHYHLYFDNFFTSVDLLQTLKERGIYACRTVRQTSRGFPPALKLSGKGKRELERHSLSKGGF